MLIFANVAIAWQAIMNERTWGIVMYTIWWDLVFSWLVIRHWLPSLRATALPMNCWSQAHWSSSQVQICGSIFWRTLGPKQRWIKPTLGKKDMKKAYPLNKRWWLPFKSWLSAYHVTHWHLREDFWLEKDGTWAWITMSCLNISQDQPVKWLFKLKYLALHPG